MSATIEELAVTATGIADNARAVAAAAEQTGDTMRDMQEKVEAIAERSLSLGERSQQKSAADQVATAMVQIRESADQLAAEQEHRVGTAERVEELVRELENAIASSAGREVAQ